MLVRASDPDGERNLQIVRLKHAVDLRKTGFLSTHKVFVLAAAGRHSDVRVYVNINDVNDNAPIFDGHPKTIGLSKNVEVEYLVMTVHARDADFGKFGGFLVGKRRENSKLYDFATWMVTMICSFSHTF